MTAQSPDLVAENVPVPVQQCASYAGPAAATAYRKADGSIVICEIGYYGDEVTLTKEALCALGYIPYYDEAP